jgi:hypothetical protein
MDGAELLRKLQVKTGARLSLLNAPAGLAPALGSLVKVVGPDEPCDAVLAFCEGPEDVARLSRGALGVLVPDGLLWFAYRKGAAAKTSGLSRDVGWAALEKAGYRGVRMISIDKAWSAKRCRETGKVSGGLRS